MRILPARLLLLLSPFVLCLPLTSASAATQCVNQNAPNLLEFCVNDYGHPAVWVNQPARTPQYYQEFFDDPYMKWGTVVWLGITPTTRFTVNSDVSNLVTPVSNVATGSGTAQDPHVITTVVDLGPSGVRMTQRFTYVNGERTLKKTWTLEHTGALTYTNARFHHGGSTFFGGTHQARSWLDTTKNMVYLTNNNYNAVGYFGFYANPATPSDRYYGGLWWLGNEHAFAYTFATMDGWLPNTVDSSYIEASYWLQWNRASFAPGDTWTFEAFAYWSPPGPLQVLTPHDQGAQPGTTVRRTFQVHNLTASSMTVNLSVAAPSAWTAVLPNGASLSLAARQVTEVPVDVTVPATSTPASTQDVSLTATSGANSNTGTTRIALPPLEYTIAPTSLDLGTIAQGAVSDVQVSLSNSTAAPSVQIGQIASGDTLGTPFSIQADTCSNTTVAGGASCSVTVRFAPSGAGVSVDSFDWPLLTPFIRTQSIAVTGTAVAGHTVTAATAAGGSIEPASVQVSEGSTTSFTVTPNVGYSVAGVTGCNGTLTGNSYTTGAIGAACTVSPSFALSSYAVTATAGTGGVISPGNATVDHGSTATFTVTANAGFDIASVQGCGGTLSGNTYTTAATTGACTVTASFAATPATVEVTTTARRGGGGTSNPLWLCALGSLMLLRRAAALRNAVTHKRWR